MRPPLQPLFEDGVNIISREREKGGFSIQGAARLGFFHSAEGPHLIFSVGLGHTPEHVHTSSVDFFETKPYVLRWLAECPFYGIWRGNERFKKATIDVANSNIAPLYEIVGPSDGVGAAYAFGLLPRRIPVGVRRLTDTLYQFWIPLGRGDKD